MDDFEHLIGSLETLPSAHAVVRDELLALAGYRWSAVGSYMAFFTIDEESSSVNVERVLHGRMNWREIVWVLEWTPLLITASSACQMQHLGKAEDELRPHPPRR
ncbi:MAG: hypothetical protein IJ087_19140 [Eggerthellaceae bacterium]|nr:hypothetical protein [Eggerthellaceae bacterium]